MGLFSKKKEEKKCCCGGSCNAESMKAAEVCKAGGASVKILGSGCAKCNQLEANTLEALKQLGLRHDNRSYHRLYANCGIRRDDNSSPCGGR